MNRPPPSRNRRAASGKSLEFPRWARGRHSSLARSASVIIVKPLESRVSRPISILSTISATAGRPRLAHQQRIRLNDVHLGLKQGGADLQQRLIAQRQLDADQIAFDQGQPGTLQDFAALAQDG